MSNKFFRQADCLFFNFGCACGLFTIEQIYILRDEGTNKPLISVVYIQRCNKKGRAGKALPVCFCVCAILFFS